MSDTLNMQESHDGSLALHIAKSDRPKDTGKRRRISDRYRPVTLSHLLGTVTLIIAAIGALIAWNLTVSYGAYEQAMLARQDVNTRLTALYANKEAEDDWKRHMDMHAEQNIDERRADRTNMMLIEKTLEQRFGSMLIPINEKLIQLDMKLKQLVKEKEGENR